MIINRALVINGLNSRLVLNVFNPFLLISHFSFYDLSGHSKVHFLGIGQLSPWSVSTCKSWRCWVGTMKVDNQEVWDSFIKTGQLRGFSVEGEFAHEPFEEKKLSDIEKIVSIIERIK